MAVEIELVEGAHLLLRGGGHIGRNKTFPDILNSDRTRMKHIVGIETIVAQFVEEDFVGGEDSPAPIRDTPLHIVGGNPVRDGVSHS